MLKAKLVKEMFATDTITVRVYQTEINEAIDEPGFDHLMVTAVRIPEDPETCQTAAYICADENGTAITGEPYAALSVFSPEVLLYQMGYGLVDN